MCRPHITITARSPLRLWHRDSANKFQSVFKIHLISHMTISMFPPPPKLFSMVHIHEIYTGLMIVKQCKTRVFYIKIIKYGCLRVKMCFIFQKKWGYPHKMLFYFCFIFWYPTMTYCSGDLFKLVHFRTPASADMWWLLKHAQLVQAGGTHPTGIGLSNCWG